MSLGLVACRGKPATPPSVVLVVVDTLRGDYLGCAGFQGPISPNVDRLAHEGFVFENCFAQSPWTKPSVATLFTSLNPEVHKVLTEGGRYRGRGQGKLVADVLGEEMDTLAESFERAGYATAAFVANPWIRTDLGYGQGFTVFPNAEVIPDAKHPGERIVAAAAEWLSGRDRGKPFFLYVHFMDVHGPYDAPEEDFAAVAASPGLGPSVPMDDAAVKTVPSYLMRPPWASAEGGRDVRTWRGRYAAGVHKVDRHIGELRQALEQTGAFEQSIVVVTSDHGEELSDHDRWDHGYRLYDEQLHVPLVMRLPGGARVGRDDRVVNLLDVAPTLLALAGLPTPTAFEGRSLVPLLEGQRQPWAELTIASAVKWKPMMASVRTRRHKLIVHEKERETELFDLASDQKERNNIADREAGVASELRGKLDSQRAADRARGAAPVVTALPRSAEEALRALGYLDKK